jgi:hypothetical protein
MQDVLARASSPVQEALMILRRPLVHDPSVPAPYICCSDADMQKLRFQYRGKDHDENGYLSCDVISSYLSVLWSTHRPTGFFHLDRWYAKPSPLTQRGEYSISDLRKLSQLETCHTVVHPVKLPTIPHWVLLVWTKQDRTARLYNSLSVDRSIEMQLLVTFTLAMVQVYRLPTACVQWEVVSNVPQQDNGYDCGVYVCMFVHLLVLGLPLCLSRAHASCMRQRIIRVLESRSSPAPPSGDTDDSDEVEEIPNFWRRPHSPRLSPPPHNLVRL